MTNRKCQLCTKIIKTRKERYGKHTYHIVSKQGIYTAGRWICNECNKKYFEQHYK